MLLTFGDLKQIWGEAICLTPQNLNTTLGTICTDSRQIRKGDFFIALQGKSFDGHNFLLEAFEGGAQGAVISATSSIQVPEGFVYWKVPNTLQAYQQLCLLHRKNLNIPLIAVTGSVGKTTTRELVKSSLESLGKVVATTENNNNDIGVPLTVLAADASHQAIIVEMGMRGLGEIKRLSKCTEPNIAIITNVGSAHLELLGSLRNIAKAKCEVTSFLSSSGVVVIPEGYRLLEEELIKVWNGRVIRVGIFDNGSSQFISNENILPNLPKADLIGEISGDNSELLLEGEVYKLPVEGRHNALNFLLAIAVARELGVSNESLKQLNTKIPAGRHTILRAGQITLIDETYNSSPESVKAALNLLVSKPGRHFAVLGTMLELGDQSDSFHRQIVEYAAEKSIDGLVIVSRGLEEKVMREASGTIPLVEVVPTSEQAFYKLQTWLRPGDVVLLKASRAIGLERLISLFLED
ncbi:UDP-N-acetylmuramoyl-tripeptide--D-alanyl-D-alanine ligase [Prochlorococcus sp. MIT 1307]|uniref:UDP-N-acetylmuramoyl-tripeptide--D-alanyl-D- alanine ligase n=1 Tax=Prochlorococcus sp. MIT 1307 TaxID=3096219 RepID=UPI002A74C361|nr:UDP-N-acetylmuramoyl-tripeptide--D-alanyl-D-alanine ligase [Prochlorococcus sp. MIT 1307]